MKEVLVIFVLLGNFEIAFGQNESSPLNHQAETFPTIKCMFFFIPDCPACRNNMIPLMDLKERYEAKGLKIEAVLSDPTPDRKKLMETVEEHQFYVPIVFDSTLMIAGEYGVTTTPQVVLLNGSNQIVYSGAFNNYYYRFGKHRSHPNKFYLEDAVKATLKNRLPDFQFTEPIGCKINFN